MNKKLGMSNFQIGILVFIGILTFGIIGVITFFIFNQVTGKQVSFLSDSAVKIVGKWEVVSGSRVGELFEFFPDGTLNTSSFGSIASKYSYPDQTHIKIETGNLGVVFEYTLSNDQLSLTNSSSSYLLKRYEELSLNSQTVAGVWKKNFPDKSECFKGLGISTPQEIVLEAGGNFSLSGGAASNVFDITMNGIYTINGSNLYITASGIHEFPTPSPFMGAIGSSDSPTATPAPPLQLNGELNCIVTVSNSRLNFKDALNNITVFVR